MAAAQRPGRILRSIGAVFAGFVAVVVLSLGTDQVLHAAGVFPPWGRSMSDALFVLATAYRTLYATLGSYLTARLAPHRPMAHALVVGGVGLVLSSAGAIATWDRDLGPRWYPLALVATAMPCAWAGGQLRALRIRDGQR